MFRIALGGTVNRLVVKAGRVCVFRSRIDGDGYRLYQLSLESSFSTLPDTLEAGAPAGYSLGLNVPQRNEPDGLATPDVKDVKLTLPKGVVINPSAAWGLKACSSGQFYGAGHGPGHLVQESANEARCPREAQVGKVKVKYAALSKNHSKGKYIWPNRNVIRVRRRMLRSGKMVRLFLQVVGEGESGIVVKLEGHGRIDQQTGQITTTFENNPQLPFSELEIDAGRWPAATLANPRTCGAVTSSWI